MVFGYEDEDELGRPSIVSAHGLKLEVDTKASKTVATDRMVSTRFTGLTLNAGDTFDVLSFKEKGQLHSIEVVVDNPYAILRLEMDDYINNPEGGGETAAELLLSSRTGSRPDGAFQVTNRLSDGSYVLRYQPMMPKSYDKQIKFSVSNFLRTTSDVFGSTLSFKSRRNLPTPIDLQFIGGGTFTHSGMDAVSLPIMAEAIAKPIGATNGGYVVNDTYNELVYLENVTTGTANPYSGSAGKPIFTDDEIVDDSPFIDFVDSGSAGSFARGQDGSAVAHPALTGGADFPGTTSTASTQNIILYGTNNDSTAVLGDEAAGASMDSIAVGSRIFIRNKGTVFFPGKVEKIYRYNRSADTGSDGWAASDAGATYTNATGAICLQVSPGLNATASTFQATGTTTSIGVVTTKADSNPTISIRSINVKRYREVSFEG